MICLTVRKRTESDQFYPLNSVQVSVRHLQKPVLRNPKMQQKLEHAACKHLVQVSDYVQMINLRDGK